MSAPTLYVENGKFGSGVDYGSSPILAETWHFYEVMLAEDTVRVLVDGKLLLHKSPGAK